MKNLTVLLARAVAWVEVIDLNPRGRIFYPSLVAAMVERYHFPIFPQKVEDYDETKGIRFAGGRYEDTVIEQVLIYTHGVVLETRTTTDRSREVLKNAFEWAADTLGLAYEGDSSIRHWQYYSQLTFNSDRINLNLLHPGVQRLATRLSQDAHDSAGEGLKFELVNFVVGHDLTKRKNPFGAFSLQRRDSIPFEENKYYSDAPVQTDVHVSMLKEFEESF